MRHGSLFSGIGGFDYAAQQMGWGNVFHCEWNEFGQKVLKYYWPKAITYNDITKTDFTIHRGTIDVLTGGFPCQPYSQAGKRLGKEDDRHLWPEMLRAIREIEPAWVVGENVLGLVNWNGGLVFEEVQTDLEAQGYEVQPFVLPAAGVNAPHRRDRVWFVAYSERNANRLSTKRGLGMDGELLERRKRKETADGSNIERENETFTNPNSNGLERSHSEHEVDSSQRGFDALGDTFESVINGTYTDSERIRLQYRTETGDVRKTETLSEKQRSKPALSIETDGNGHKSYWQNFPTVSPICNGDDGFSERLDSITFSKWRNESIKAGGNAIVPQIALQIFKAIELYNSTLSL